MAMWWISSRNRTNVCVLSSYQLLVSLVLSTMPCTDAQISLSPSLSLSPRPPQVAPFLVKLVSPFMLPCRDSLPPEAEAAVIGQPKETRKLET